MIKVLALPRTPAELINIGVLGFLLTPIFSSWEHLARGFFFALVMPAVIWLVIRRQFVFSRYRDFFVPFAALSVYLACSALIFSEAGTEQAIRRVRWLLEIIAWVIALFVAIPRWKDRSDLYGAIFVAAAGLAGAAGLLGWGLQTGLEGRLIWVGYLRQSIQGPSMLICFWLIGLWLLLQKERLTTRDSVVTGAAYVALLAFGLCTGSRGPLISLMLAFPLLAMANAPHRLSVVKIGVIFGFAALAGVLVWLGADVLDISAREMLTRDTMSIRFAMWKAVFELPPPSIIWGWGIATDFIDTAPGQHFFQLFQDDFSHVHNSLLNVYFSSGLVGLVLTLTLMAVVLRRGFKAVQGQRLTLFLFLIFLAALAALHVVESYRLVSSPNPDWTLVWVVMVFIHIGVGRQTNIARAES